MTPSPTKGRHGAGVASTPIVGAGRIDQGRGVDGQRVLDRHGDDDEDLVARMGRSSEAGEQVAGQIGRQGGEHRQRRGDRHGANSKGGARLFTFIR